MSLKRVSMDYKELKSFCGGEGLSGSECGSRIHQEDHRQER